MTSPRSFRRIRKPRNSEASPLSRTANFCCRALRKALARDWSPVIKKSSVKSPTYRHVPSAQNRKKRGRPDLRLFVRLGGDGGTWKNLLIVEEHELGLITQLGLDVHVRAPILLKLVRPLA
eukprot:scaffold4875_cov296-Pinguiococcus_pyrenoidosus.AAC.1